VLPFFNPEGDRQLHIRNHAIVDDAIDAFIETGRADLVRDYAELIPPRAVAPLIGLDREDIPLFARWTREMFDKGAAGDLDGQAQAAGELFSHSSRYSPNAARTRATISSPLSCRHNPKTAHH